MLREGSVTTSDGRTLAYVERGPDDGMPLVVCHGTPGSRYTHPPDLSIYDRYRVHAIVYDRPGYGRSDPKPGRTIADAADDVETLAEALDFDRFAILGGSGGAPHALACGARLGDRIIRVGALVTPAPSDDPDFDFFAGLAELNVKEFTAALEGREAIDTYIQPFVDAIRRDPDSVIDEIVSELPEVDGAIAAREDHRAAMLEGVGEAVRQGVRGWADDDLAFAKPWGFALEDVQVEVRLWQGELDVLSPRSHGEYVAQRLPNASFDLLEGGGHFLDEEWSVVYDWLATGAGVA